MATSMLLCKAATLAAHTIDRSRSGGTILHWYLASSLVVTIIAWMAARKYMLRQQLVSTASCTLQGPQSCPTCAGMLLLS